MPKIALLLVESHPWTPFLGDGRRRSDATVTGRRGNTRSMWGQQTQEAEEPVGSSLGKSAERRRLRAVHAFRERLGEQVETRLSAVSGGDTATPTRGERRSRRGGGPRAPLAHSRRPLFATARRPARRPQGAGAAADLRDCRRRRRGCSARTAAARARGHAGRAARARGCRGLRARPRSRPGARVGLAVAKIVPSPDQNGSLTLPETTTPPSGR